MTDLPRIDVFAFELKDRAAGHHFQGRQSGQAADDAFGNPVGNKLGVRLGAGVCERQHSDRVDRCVAIARLVKVKEDNTDGNNDAGDHDYAGLVLFKSSDERVRSPDMTCAFQFVWLNLRLLRWFET